MKFLIYEDMELVAKSRITQVNDGKKIEALAQQIMFYLVDEFDVNLTKAEQKELIKDQKNFIKMVVETQKKECHSSLCCMTLEIWLKMIYLTSQELPNKMKNSLAQKLNDWLTEREEESEFFTGLLEQAEIGELYAPLPEEWFNFDEECSVSKPKTNSKIELLEVDAKKFIGSKNEQGLQIGRTGEGRGYHIEFLGVRDYDPNQNCHHCQKPLEEVIDLLVISHDGKTADKEISICDHCGLNIEKD